jgi:hypothetical protein
MDYTTLAKVKAAMHVDQATDDVLLATVVTAASRALDRICTGQADLSASNYFMLETKTNENLIGQANRNREIICFPQKPVVNSVQAFSYRSNITTTEYVVDPTRIDIIGNKVVVYPDGISIDYPRRCKVKISYTGGFSGSTAGLPEDFQEICTLLAVRFYREAETGFSDVIGVAELATKIYTKAWPLRVEYQLDTFIRKQGWNYPG